MRPYGIPREKDAEFPDMGDIHKYGFASRTGKKTKSGEYKSPISSKKRRKARRYWKKKERRNATNYIRSLYED